MEVIDSLAIGDLLTETDSPYLSPEPFRGKTNTPKNIPIIVDFITKRKNLSIEECANAIRRNAKELFTKLK